MRLFRIFIDQFRSIQDQHLPANGLIVLFGANSAGKTSALEAVHHLITRDNSFRPDPGAEEDPLVLGSVMFCLPDVAIPESEDARLYLSLLRNEFIGPGIFGEPPAYPWDWLDEERRQALKDLGLTQVKEKLTDWLTEDSTAGSREDRELLARSIFDATAVYFVADWPSVSMNLWAPALPEPVRAVAARIARDPGEDMLSKAASALVTEGWAHVAWVADDSARWGDLAKLFPPVITLDGDIESLSAEIESTIVAVHNRLWEFDPTVADPSGSLMRIVVGEDVRIGSWGESDRFTPDPWLEARSEDGNGVLPHIFAPYDQGDWYRVRHSVLAAAQLVEREANQVAPEFVKNMGRIGIEVLPVSVWGSAGHRVRATFTEDGTEKRDLRVVGAGTGRWAAAAIRLAARRLGQGRQVVVDENGDVVVNDEDARRRLVSEALRDPLAQTSVGLEPSDAPAVYIADEPEAHLHPAALQSVATWLGQLAHTAAMVIVATHSTALLDCRTEVIHRVLVRQTDQGTKLQLMTGNLGDELKKASNELGLTQGELLLMTRLALFVEGRHDKMILEEWFGDCLGSAGIRIYEVGGVTSLPLAVSSELLPALGIHVATLSDNTSMESVVAGTPRTNEERTMVKLVKVAKDAGIQVQSFGLNEPDILYYLDEVICRSQAPEFPGWKKAHEQAESKSVKDWKKWVDGRYRVPINREGIRELARECRAQGKIPAEITQKIDELIAYASTRTTHTAAPE